MIPYLLLIIGFLLLIKGADFLVDGASSIAKRLRISNLVIGLTIVAFGTSLPELFVNIVATVKGNPGIAIGDVLGSNTANILLVLGISSIIFPLTVKKGTVWKEIPFCLLAALLLGILANTHLIYKNNSSGLTRIDGLILIFFFIIFMYYSFIISKNTENIQQQISTREYGLIKSSLLIIIGLIGLGVGARWIIDGAVNLALRFGVSELLIGLTIVAIGTSLPELATSAVAAYKRNTEIAVGNVIGSNILNIFLVLGISSIIKPLPFQAKNNIDIGMVVIASLLLFLSMFSGKRRSLDRWEGVIFVSLYVSYIIFLILHR